jgi:hypothetical protein
MPTLAEAKLKLAPTVVKQLQQAIDQRQQQLKEEVPIEQAREVVNKAKAVLEEAGLSPAAVHAVGQCLWRRTRTPTFSQRVAMVLLAAEQGDSALPAVYRELSLRPLSD